MSSLAFAFFEEFGDYCHEHHPGDISLNASTLVRTGVVGPRRHQRARVPREALRRRGGLEWMAVRTALRRAALRARLSPDPISLLCYFPFGRVDYEGLVRPFVKGIVDVGGRSAVAVPGRGMKRWSDHARHDGSVVRPLEAGANLATYLEARRTLEVLRPGLSDVANRFTFDGGTRRDFVAYFAQFAFEKALAATFLAAFTPTVVFGIHFVTSRGWHAAIQAASPSAPKPTVILVQHGAFDVAEEFHDFEGADVVLLWGDRWRRELLAFPTTPFLPLPAAVVTGNPKYDLVHDTAPQAFPSPEGRSLGRRVLFASGHEDGRTKVGPLELAIAAARRGRGFDLVVKPHPAARDDAIAGFVGRGDLRSESVLAASYPIQAGIHEADIVVGPESTTLFEAVRIGKPVVLLSEGPSRAFEGFFTASDADGLHAFVERCANDSVWRHQVIERQRLVLEDAFGRGSGAIETGVALVRSYL